MKSIIDIFFLTLKQVGVKTILFLSLATIFLSSFFVFYKKEEIYRHRKLLFPDKTAIYEKQKILDTYAQEIDEKELEELKKEVKKELLEMEAADRYQIIYENDPRVFSLKQWSLLKSDLEELQEEEKISEVRLQLEELEYQMSLSYRDSELLKLEKLRSDLSDVKLLPDTKEKENKLYQLKEKIELAKYVTIPNIHIYHPNVAMVNDAYLFLNESLDISMDEDSFYQNENMLKEYKDYASYLVSFEKKVENAKKQYAYMKEKLRLGIQDSYYDNGYIGDFKMQDGLLTIFSVTTIITIAFLFFTIQLFHNDYENNTIIQYKMHTSMKHYLLGKYMTIFFLLFVAFSLSLFANGIVSYLLAPEYIPAILLIPADSIFVTVPYIIWFLLQYLFLYLVSILLIIIIGIVSTIRIPRSVIYFISFVLIGFCFYQSECYLVRNLVFLKYLPFTYINYSKLCRYHMLPSLTVLYQLVVIAILFIVIVLFGHIKLVKKTII